MAKAKAKAKAKTSTGRTRAKPQAAAKTGRLRAPRQQSARRSAEDERLVALRQEISDKLAEGRKLRRDIEKRIDRMLLDKEARA
jgi:hypothetical protein